MIKTLSARGLSRLIQNINGFSDMMVLVMVLRYKPQAGRQLSTSTGECRTVDAGVGSI